LIAVRGIKIFKLDDRATDFFNTAASGASQINFLVRRTVALRLAAKVSIQNGRLGKLET
jgi:hypothetical protein